MSNSVQLMSAGREFSGPEVTWAGPHPFLPGVCFGFEDGSIVFGEEGKQGTTAPNLVSKAGEAINGVAAIGKTSIAVSTRADVTFIEIENKEKTSISRFNGGAHHVVATPSGYFLAPMGQDGLLLVKPERGPHQTMRASTGTRGVLYFYRMAVLHKAKQEVLIFANRREGVGTCKFDPHDDSRNVHTRSFLGLDAIDVCEIKSGELSAVAISPKAEVMVFRDVLEESDPVALKLGGITGEVYRVLCNSKHLFILTSKAFYTWFDFVQTVFNKTPPRKPPLMVPLEAIDMNMYKDYILIVMAENAVRAINISHLESLIPNFQSAEDKNADLTAQPFTPRWESKNVEQGMMVGAGT